MSHNDRNITTTRKKLYEQAWSQPMIKLSKEYGLSDTGLRKICIKYKIPIPKAGHWQRIQHDKPFQQIPLPEPENDEAITITPFTKENVDLEFQSKILFETLSENKIIVPEKIRKWHPFVEDMRKDMSKDYQHSNFVSSIGIRVGKGSSDRALRIMDSFIKALDSRNIKFFIDQKKYFSFICVNIGNETFGLDLYEKAKIVKKNKEPLDFTSPEYIPIGILMLRLSNAWGPCRHCTDGKNQKLEDCLNKFIQALYKEASKEKIKKIELEKEQRRWEEVRLKREAEEKERQEEQARFNKLETESVDWQKSRLIRRYIEATKKIYIQEHGTIETGSDFDKWIAWATQKADCLDPLKNTFHK